MLRVKFRKHRVGGKVVTPDMDDMRTEMGRLGFKHGKLLRALKGNHTPHLTGAFPLDPPSTTLIPYATPHWGVPPQTVGPPPRPPCIHALSLTGAPPSTPLHPYQHPSLGRSSPDLTGADYKICACTGGRKSGRVPYVVPTQDGARAVDYPTISLCACTGET